MSIPVGEVISIRGTVITLMVYEESNKETLFYDGEKYKGVSIKEHLLIKRGFKNIVALVQGEYLDEKLQGDAEGTFVRKIELKPIGYFEKDQFVEGIKSLPMIRDVAYLMKEEEVRSIYSGGGDFFVGKLASDDVRISLPWDRIFNSHVGVFGNTGSGKSNTLTALYTKLFQQKKEAMRGKSQFFVIDFNGEYTNNQILAESEGKKVYRLSTRGSSGDKYPIPPSVFWDVETLGVLFRATENTQKPFLDKVVAGRVRYGSRANSLSDYVRNTLHIIFSSSNQKPEYPDMIKRIVGMVGFQSDGFFDRIDWHNHSKVMYVDWSFFRDNCFFGTADVNGGYFKYARSQIDSIPNVNLNDFDELLLRVELRLLLDLNYNHVQFDFIRPLIRRIENSIRSMSSIFIVSNDRVDSLLTVISLRQVNQDLKKLVPLFLAKDLYGDHKNKVDKDSPPKKTAHLIIDEAHNILSMQSNRENETWKDYRLELFEEIIKEGRKFGFYLTLSSQRPADISPTIMSQIHNFFIHRLVNDRDLFLLENTISSLDNFSRAMIPNLGKGCAVITGVSFDLPMIVQFDQLEASEKPDSDDVNLNELWNKPLDVMAESVGPEDW